VFIVSGYLLFCQKLYGDYLVTFEFFETEKRRPLSLRFH